jgi:hypothetical protein
MKRFALDNLIKWKADEKKKPLIIRGARQVGKTWLMKEFGNRYYENTIYIGFDNNPAMKELFSRDLNVARIIKGIEMAWKTKINPDNTLLIFDEVQEAPPALTSLKYFNENAPEYQIVAAGSLLGVALHHGTSFPVGKVDFMDLYPLSFKEFLCAAGSDNLAECLRERDYEMAGIFKHDFIDRLKEYYYVGGMPEVVNDFVQNRDFDSVRDIQSKILLAYELDFSKHAPNNEVPRIRMLWNSIPAQLAKENKKFIYGLIREGARARDYELALLWLSDCGLIHKLSRISKPYMPLKAYEDMKAFKLFMLDVGLLAALTGLDITTLLKGNDVFTEFKGALTEQFVIQQLKPLKNLPLYYWTNDRGNAEIDFVAQSGAKIIPIEAKASINLRAKSLKVYRENFKPEIAVRVSMADYKEQEGLIDLPLYAIEEIGNLRFLCFEN